MLRRWRSGDGDDELVELERLFGGAGSSISERLGAPSGVERDDLRVAVLEAHARWQRKAEHPMSSRAVVDAAQVATGTCESLVAALTPFELISRSR